MCACHVLWRGEGRAGRVCSRKMLSRRVLETKSIRCLLVMDANRESAGTEKGKEKTDEDSSVLLYFMKEEGERE